MRLYAVVTLELICCSITVNSFFFTKRRFRFVICYPRDPFSGGLQTSDCKTKWWFFPSHLAICSLVRVCMLSLIKYHMQTNKLENWHFFRMLGLRLLTFIDYYEPVFDKLYESRGTSLDKGKYRSFFIVLNYSFFPFFSYSFLRMISPVVYCDRVQFKR